jgi:hypothetical protein
MPVTPNPRDGACGGQLAAGGVCVAGGSETLFKLALLANKKPGSCLPGFLSRCRNDRDQKLR